MILLLLKKICQTNTQRLGIFSRSRVLTSGFPNLSYYLSMYKTIQYNILYFHQRYMQMYVHKI